MHCWTPPTKAGTLRESSREIGEIGVRSCNQESITRTGCDCWIARPHSRGRNRRNRGSDHRRNRAASGLESESGRNRGLGIGRNRASESGVEPNRAESGCESREYRARISRIGGQSGVANGGSYQDNLLISFIMTSEKWPNLGL